ncbi:hypothetical protein [Clostridium estertheticum]|uniref:hypothetical protein n=1 Tax=Clostridium estertheticum TaxID=238834 RepID=UPI00147982CE|nr:hypothetical protein [Clostridium estertheticum]MBU3171687.1 hypothetical protein [Clostridium estertheticum]MBZ9618378.1 hypothetical protein [Clostridium estertheticum subsp. laramiense]
MERNIEKLEKEIVFICGVVTAKRKFTTLRHIFTKFYMVKQLLNISASEMNRQKNSHKTAFSVFDEL